MKKERKWWKDSYIETSYDLRFEVDVFATETRFSRRPSAEDSADSDRSTNGSRRTDEMDFVPQIASR